MDFVKALHELGALANGEYIIISIDDFNYDLNSNAQQYTSRSKLMHNQQNHIEAHIYPQI